MLLEKLRILPISLLIFSFTNFSSIAQQRWQDIANRADSLRRAGNYKASLPHYRKVLKTIPKSEREAILSNNIRIGLSYFMHGENRQAQRHFEHVLYCTTKDSISIYRGHALNNLGLLYDNLGQFKQSLVYYKRALNLFQHLDNSFQIDLAKMNMGIVHQKRGQYREGLELLTEASLGFMERGDSSQLGETYNTIAGIQDILGNTTKAKYFYRETIKIQTRIHDRYGLATTYNNIGIIAMNENNVDSALYYYRTALNLMNQTSDRNIGLVYHNLGLLSMRAENAEQARVFFRRAFEHKQSISDTSGMVITLNKQVELEIAAGNYRLARMYLNQTKRLLDHSANPRNFKEHYDQWKEYYKGTGNGDSALLYLEKSNSLSRIINEENYQKELALLQESFEAEKRTNEIGRLHRSNEFTREELTIAEQMIEYRDTFLGFAAMVILVMIIILYIRKQQVTKHLLRAKIQGIETEKNRLSQELHDMTGTEILSIKSDLEKYLFSGHTPAFVEFASKLHKRVHSLSSSIIRISHELKLPDLSSCAFSIVLSDMIYDWNEFKNYRCRIEFENTELINLIPMDHAQHVYRFIAESLNNVDKHARATEILISSKINETKLTLFVTDNGTCNGNIKPGIGHRNLKERATDINGRFNFNSTQNGSTSSFSIPIPS